MANSIDPDQTAPIGVVCSGSTLFASLLNSSVILGNYLQQTTSANDNYRCIFGALRIKLGWRNRKVIKLFLFATNLLNSIIKEQGGWILIIV